MNRSMWQINELYHIVKNQVTTTQSQKGHEEPKFEKNPKEPLANTANTLVFTGWCLTLIIQGKIPYKQHTASLVLV